MAIKTVTCYVVQCDKCWANLERDNHEEAHHESEKKAREYAYNCDWLGDDGSYLCPDCQTRRLAEAAPAMLAALREAEWGGCSLEADGRKWITCPVCDQPKHRNHAADCKLAAAIAAGEGRTANGG